MCELFGISSQNRLKVNDLLKEFYSHSDMNPNGWGLAVFHKNIASIEKEPISAKDSLYLRYRLRHSIEAKTLIAHIRLATVGSTDYENCHPFVRQDATGRRWTLAHNGTVFHGEMLNPYFYKQEGKTDSERILLYIIDKINMRHKQAGTPLNAEQRFAIIDSIICDLAKDNKLNLLIYDGEMMYVHTNYSYSLYISQSEDTTLLSTKPIGDLEWNELPMNTLMSYRYGKHIYSGTNHGMQYLDNEQDLKYLHLDSSSL